jgi:restriction system protein
MPIPDFQSVMRPLLQFAGDGADHTLRDAITTIADEFKLTDEEKATLLPSGRMPVFRNRIYWANTYLQRAGLLSSEKRGVFRVTPAGLDVLKSGAAVNVKFLKTIPSFAVFYRGTRGTHDVVEKPELSPETVRTADEIIEEAHQSLRDVLAQDLLEGVMKASPSFFEFLVVELLVKMGYGGSRKDAGERVGQSGDGGIDGIIKEDRLGLDVIYIQAKRWQDSVGRPEIQKFVGALQGHHARKGVFITTSTFTKDAVEYAAKVDSKVVLIDGRRLTDLMIDFDLGVTTTATYAVKRVDSDYFDEE